ncbi:MAG: divalent-cation tolerance protein CutA [Thermosphaera sp.]
MEGGWILVLITTSNYEEASKIARTLVESKLAACVNIVREVSSIYWWEGKIEQSGESLLLVKTTIERLENLVRKVKEEHSYSVPEIIAVPIIGGNKDYLSWIRASTS